MKNKKGFTLIELLAVIVILAIIALIAVPVVLNMIENARKSAAKSSAYGYIDAINNNNELASMKNNNMENIPDTISDGTYDVAGINIKIKGKKPDSGEVTITNGRVVSATNLCFYNYPVSYNGTVAEVGSKGCSGSGNNGGSGSGGSSSNTPKSLTPQTDLAGPTTTTDGTVVYFDPVSSSKCDSTTFNLDAVKNGNSTCYKWRIISKNGNNLTVQLDHNLVNDSCWVNINCEGSDVTVDGPKAALTNISSATVSWSRLPALNYKYETNNYGKLSCEAGVCKKITNNVDAELATNVKARLITAEEVIQIIKNAGLDSATSATKWNYLYEDKFSFTDIRLDGINWLIENTATGSDKSLNQSTGSTRNIYTVDGSTSVGYWSLTPTSNRTGCVWGVQYTGNFTSFTVFSWTGGIAYYGLRPVITLPKCVFDGNKCSGWHLINPDTESWSYYQNNGNIIQNGWGRGLLDLSGKSQDYYFENGTAVKGWKTIDNKKYYFSETDADNNGYIDYNKVYGGDIEINGTTYTFDNNGVCTSNNC